jgi:hypothetical protein
MTPARIVGSFTACFAAFAGAFASSSSSVLLHASPAALVLNVRMVSTQDLPPLTRLSLIVEAQTIWNDGHVRLRWISRDADAEGEPVLPVLVMARVVPPAGDAGPFTVGELVRHEGIPAMAVASITGARRIVEGSPRFSLFDAPDTHDRRVGVVLGRALAHEIGHYMLQTNTHAVDGLMRARIQAEEFADLRRGTFRLDRAAAAHLAAIAAAGSLPAGARPFSYESN